jgi:hypothetical protein
MNGAGGSGVARDADLLAFADAAIAPEGDPTAARLSVTRQFGDDGMTDAAAVIAGFDAITRVADGSGIPLEPPKAEATAPWRASLGIDEIWARKV